MSYKQFLLTLHPDGLRILIIYMFYKKRKKEEHNNHFVDVYREDTTNVLIKIDVHPQQPHDS